MQNLKQELAVLEKEIKSAYESSPTLDEAEKLAARFLAAQILLGTELARVDLDTRMRKSGLKAIKAAVFLHNAQSGEKKPSDKVLDAIVDKDETVGEAQDAFDKAEVGRNELQNWLQVCQEAHIYFRGVAKGRFE